MNRQLNSQIVQADNLKKIDNINIGKEPSLGPEFERKLYKVLPDILEEIYKAKNEASGYYGRPIDITDLVFKRFPKNIYGEAIAHGNRNIITLNSDLVDIYQKNSDFVNYVVDHEVRHFGQGRDAIEKLLPLYAVIPYEDKIYSFHLGLALLEGGNEAISKYEFGNKTIDVYEKWRELAKRFHDEVMHLPDLYDIAEERTSEGILVKLHEPDVKEKLDNILFDYVKDYEFSKLSNMPRTEGLSSYA